MALAPGRQQCAMRKSPVPNVMNPPRPRRSLGTVGIGPLGMLWCVLVGHCSPSAAHEIPIEFWAVSLMPLCLKHVDGFATKAEVPYSKWRSKHHDA